MNEKCIIKNKKHAAVLNAIADLRKEQDNARYKNAELTSRIIVLEYKANKGTDNDDSFIRPFLAGMITAIVLLVFVIGMHTILS